MDFKEYFETQTNSLLMYNNGIKILNNFLIHN